VEYKFSRKFAAGISPSVYFVGYAGITGKTTSSDEDLVNWKNLPGDLNRFVFSAVSRISYYFNNQWSIHLFYRKDLTPVGVPITFPAPYEELKLEGAGISVNLRYQLKSQKTSEN
jgi:hypothetical protein